MSRGTRLASAAAAILLPAGAAVFFIAGRDEPQRAATARNLVDVGYLGYAGLSMEPVGAHYDSAADFKAPQRAHVEAHPTRSIGLLDG